MYPDASIFKIGFSFPLPENKIRKFSQSVKELFVIEELEPYLEEHVRMLGVKCKAKHSSFRIGELRPEYIKDIVNEKEKKEDKVATRKPVMCPGCPHRAVFWALKKLKLIVTGDIGCYTLGALAPINSLHTCLCMGSSITFFEGFKRVLDKQVVGVIGDSTFVHTGIPGLINLSYNQMKGLVIILDNGTTAMTGNQPHPATGLTIKGNKTKRLNLEELSRSCGADNVCVVNPHQVKELEESIRKSLSLDALSVIIARAPCMLLTKEKDQAPSVDKNKCKKCYICLSLDCPALKKCEDGSVEINEALCSGCNLCIEVCNAKAIYKK
jgi:indolepyruvate ferredoxin oxidoreductase alpha subunit